MKTNSSFSVLVWLYKHKATNKEKAPLYGRITVNGKRAEIALKYSVNPSKWDVSKCSVKGRDEEAKTINSYIDSFKLKVHKIYDASNLDGAFFTADSIKKAYLGENEMRYTLLYVFEKHIKDIEQLIGKGISYTSLLKFKTTKKYLELFLKLQYKKTDIYLKELKITFLYDFEHYLRVQCNHQSNTAKKYLQRVQQIARIALKNEWIDKYPFYGYTIKCENTNRQFLTKDDLESILKKEFTIQRLEEVRDIFVFSCYTGISYIDVSNLKKTNVERNNNNELWIRGQRQKTNTNFSVPLLPPALKILQKYEQHPKVLNSGKILPVITNQKMNAYLKEIADVCGIEKNLTFHMARHTFATTITLSNGVPIETVSKILGHTNIRTTQIYAKVIDSKISEDMKNLKYRLAMTE